MHNDCVRAGLAPCNMCELTDHGLSSGPYYEFCQMTGDGFIIYDCYVEYYRKKIAMGMKSHYWLQNFPWKGLQENNEIIYLKAAMEPKELEKFEKLMVLL